MVDWASTDSQSVIKSTWGQKHKEKKEDEEDQPENFREENLKEEKREEIKLRYV